MQAKIHRWSETQPDRPVDHLLRRRIFGDNVLVAQIHLETGCVVNPHAHPSEQVSIVLSGKTRWWLDDDEHEYIASAGEVLVLPGGCKHGCEALEDSDLIDILSPPSAMGVDVQGRS
jgi:quercetin dioxygenase-like cupin family protein